MVRTILKTLRPAVAMIELIFALVIMAIVMMSAPMLINTASNSGYAAMQQEGINEAASRINMIMGYPWDENNTDSTYIPILQTDSTVNALSIVGNTFRRVGTPIESQRTFIFFDTNRTQLISSKTLGLDGIESENNEDDIDDFIGNSKLINIETASGEGEADYIEKISIKINTAVAYVDDELNDDAANRQNYSQNILTYEPFLDPVGGIDSTHIKSIVVTLTSTDTTNKDLFEKTIVLRAFSCNIGSYTLEERTF